MVAWPFPAPSMTAEFNVEIPFSRGSQMEFPEFTIRAVSWDAFEGPGNLYAETWTFLLTAEGKKSRIKWDSVNPDPTFIVDESRYRLSCTLIEGGESKVEVSQVE